MDNFREEIGGVFEILQSMSPVWLLFGIIIFVVVGVPMIWEDEIKQNEINSQERRDLRIETNMIVRDSKDCKVLQNSMLELISKGGNADSWMLDSDDRMLKIAQERYDILCREGLK